MYKIAKENLQTLYREIAKNQELFLPEKIGEQVLINKRSRSR